MPPVLMLLALALVVLLSCCATSEVTRLARQHDEHVYALWTLPDSPMEFLTRNCPARDGGEDWGAERDLDVPNRSDCVNVAGTRNAADSEFWTFELHRIKRVTYYWAIPLSPWYKSDDTRTVGIVGARERCESVRLRMDLKPRGVSGNDAMHMTKAPCEGPKYFRRPPLNATGSAPPQPTTATSNQESAPTPLQTTAPSPPLVLAPPPLPQPSSRSDLMASATPTPPQPLSGPAQAWILGQWNSLAGMSGSVDGLAHFAFRREGSEIKWIMIRSGWFSGVQTTQKASGSVNKISESDLELVGKYDSSNLGNVAGQPLRHSFTRDGDTLKGYELANDGTQSTLSLKRGQ